VEITVDWPRVEAVLGNLLQAYRDRVYPYNWARVPQDPEHLPLSLPRGGIEEAEFFWAANYYMRGGMKSNDAMVMLGVLRDDHPEIFNFEAASELDEAWLASLLRRYRLSYRYGQIAHFWVENARRMTERWNGDPRKIFAGVTEYEECLVRVQNNHRGGGFLGFQEKMVSMVMYYYMYQGLTEFFVFPLPVDLHVLRVTISHQMITFRDLPSDGNMYSDATLRVMREMYVEYSRQHDISPLEVCNAVWLLSMALCGTTPGNVTLEPDGRGKRRGRSTRLVPLEINPDDERQRWAYKKSCGSCPSSAWCVSYVPSKYYYVGGVLIVRGERIALPEPSQFALFESLQMYAARRVNRKAPLPEFGGRDSGVPGSLFE
jgi:hypothetical protein